MICFSLADCKDSVWCTCYIDVMSWHIQSVLNRTEMPHLKI